MRRKTTVTVLSALAAVSLLGLWAYGNLTVQGDIWSGQEYLSRWVWFALNEPQREDPRHATAMADVLARPEQRLASCWCGYRLLVKVGVRLDGVPRDTVVAALIPTRSFPRWSLLGVQPPTLVLHADGGSCQASLADLPLELR